jgi:type II secretory pathway component PulF
MASFQFQALNAERLPVSGQLQADSVAHALSQLEARGLTVQSINYAFADPIDAVLAGGPGANAGPEQAALHAHLARMLQRGQTMAPALRAIAQELPHGRHRRQLERAIGILERGDATAASADVARLPEFWVPLLGAATGSRDPGRILSQFLRDTEQAAELRRQWKQSLAYPLAIAWLALSVLTVLSVWVVPIFREMFMEFDLELPAPTVLILKVSGWISGARFVIWLLLAVVASYPLLRWVGLLPDSVTIWSDSLGTPLGRSAAVARFAAFSADLLEAGLEVPTALRIAGYCTPSPRLQRAAWQLARDAERNELLPHFSLPHPLTNTVVLALRGPLHEAARIRVLREVGQCHAERAQTRLSWTRGLMEPLAIIAIALVVGFVALSLFLPLIRLVQGLSGGLA